MAASEAGVDIARLQQSTAMAGLTSQPASKLYRGCTGKTPNGKLVCHVGRSSESI